MGKIRVQPAITENNIAGIINVNQRLLDEENQPKFGSIGLRQEVLLFRGNFVTVEKRVGYLNGTLSDLERVVDEYNLRPDEEVPDSFNKKLVIQESLEKSWETQNPKINPTMLLCFLLLNKSNKKSEKSRHSIKMRICFYLYVL